MGGARDSDLIGIQKGGWCDGVLLGGGLGGGGQSRRHLGGDGGRWKRWVDDAVDVVGDSGPRETAKRGDPHCSIAAVVVHPCRVTLPRASGVWTEWEHMRISRDPHHCTKSPTYHALDTWCEGPGPGARCAGHREAPSDTTLVGVPGGWRRWWEPVRRTGRHGEHTTDTGSLAHGLRGLDGDQSPTGRVAGSTGRGGSDRSGYSRGAVRRTVVCQRLGAAGGGRGNERHEACTGRVYFIPTLCAM